MVSDKPDKTRFSVTLTSIYAEALDRVVDEGLYLDPQGAIRAALMRLFQFHGIAPFTDKGAELEGDTPSKH